MDKILLTAFLTALAGFITAALSIVKLVNEKESKTTEYRQAWTESLRLALADLIGAINSQAGAVYIDTSLRLHFLKLVGREPYEDEDQEKNRKEAMEFHKSKWKESSDSVSVLKQDIYKSYAKVRLHFKPDDTGFNRIEQKFDFCMSKLDEMRDTKKRSKRVKVKEQIHAAVGEITGFARNLLKVEWEAVKQGEPAYKRTKSWSIWVCVVMFFVLITIGVHAGISYVSKPTERQSQPTSTASSTGSANTSAPPTHL